MKHAREWGGSLALLLTVAATGTGCIGAAADNAPGGSSRDGGGASDTGIGTGGTTAVCGVTLTALKPSSFDGIVPGAAVRVRAQASGPVAADARWTWAATFADGSPVAVSQPMASDPAVGEVVAAQAGGYTISASFSGANVPCSGAAHFVVEQPGARPAFFALRLNPPPNTLPAQQVEPRRVLGGTPTGENVIMMDGGTRVPFSTRRKRDGAVVPAYVKAVETTSGLFQEGHTTATKDVALALPAGRYDVLIVPDEDLPPILVAGQRPVDLANMTFEIDEGVSVTGRLSDAAGAPMAGAKVSLRSGILPSTLGTSTPAGTFSLRARPGTYGATIAPGASLPALEFFVPAASGFQIGNAATTLSLRVATIATARIGFTFTGAGAGAKLLVEGLGPVSDAAMVEIATGETTTTMRAATMRVRAEVTIGANGTGETGPLPRGHYRATVFAAGAAPAAATITTMPDIDTTVGDVNRTMAMAQPVILSGTLRPGAATQFARVFATDDDAPLAWAAGAAAPFRAEADGSGGFALSVNPARRYRMMVEPPPGGMFARAMLPSIAVSTISVAVAMPALPKALLYAGRVVGPHLEPVAGTLVSAFCVAASADCVDPAHPVAESVTTADGSFRLALPDPGSAP